MTVTIVPVNVIAWPALTIPADGDAVNSASVAQYVQELANRCESLRQRVPGAAPVANPLRLQQDPGSALFAIGPTDWSVGSTVLGPRQLTSIALNGSSAIIPVQGLIPGAIIRTYGITLRGAGGHAALPAVMPKIELCSIDLTTALGGGGAPPITSLSTTFDTSANTAAFQLIHGITATVALTVGANQAFFIRHVTESGANSLAGEIVYGAFVEVTGQ